MVSVFLRPRRFPACADDGVLSSCLVHTPCPVTRHAPAHTVQQRTGTRVPFNDLNWKGPLFSSHQRNGHRWQSREAGRCVSFCTVKRETLFQPRTSQAAPNPAAPNTSSQDKYRGRERNLFHATAFPFPVALPGRPLPTRSSGRLCGDQCHRPEETLFTGKTKGSCQFNPRLPDNIPAEFLFVEMK